MGKLIVIGHGYAAEQLTLEAVDLLRSGAKVILHTERCGCAQWLEKEKIPFETLDALYESCEDFDEHAQAAAEAVQRAAQQEDVVYGVFDVRDRSVSQLLAMADQHVRVVAGPPVEGALLARAQGAVQMLEASDWENYSLSSARSALIREVDSRALASEVKLKLMSVYPGEHTVFVRFGEGGVARTELYNLDRLRGYDHRTCVLAPAEPELSRLERFDLDRLCEIIAILCGPDGCPWDREQTHESLRRFIVEEAYEVVDAIDEDDTDHLYDELGDMLLQIVLHADIARRHFEFDMGDVITAISEKMIRRHSHIFGGDTAENAEQVSDLWARNKMAEKGEKTHTDSLRGVPRSLPAALRASKVLKRLDEPCRCSEDARTAAKRAAEAVAKLAEPSRNAEKEAGDALLKVISVFRALDVDPELALNAASDRLIERFESVERKVLAEEGSFDAAEKEKLQKYWDLVKLSE